MIEQWWPENWREIPVAEYPSFLPRDIYQLDGSGEPYNCIWCSEDIAIAYLPPASWAVSPTWQPLAPEPEPEPEPVPIPEPK